MTIIRHGDKTIPLSAGEYWSSCSGHDGTYRDTPSGEMRALISQIEAGVPWRTAVDERYRQSFPWLYQIVTSPNRDLYFRQYPVPPGSRVLDIGSGWGQMAIPLARDCLVTALEPTDERLAFIQAAAEQDAVADNMCFVHADFLDVSFEGKFDLACCIGVLEWVPKFRDGDPRTLQLQFLRKARESLSAGGQLVVGIENRIGLKYVLGAPDDHIGTPHVAVYDQSLAVQKWKTLAGHTLRSFTYTRAELAALLEEAGFTHLEFFRAFPDYKLPEVILPLGEPVNEFFRAGRFVEEHDGTNGAKLTIQDELRSHYRSFAELNIAHEFSPSFFVSARTGG